MNELELLEQEMRGWRPRQPSAHVAQRLFGTNRTVKASGKVRPASSRLEFWSWLTPVVACSLTIMLAVGTSGHRENLIVTKNGPVFIEGLLLYPGESNSTGMVELTASDANVQWNAYPQMVSLVTQQGGGTSKERTGGTNLNRTF